jgi:hypothetical protein
MCRLIWVIYLIITLKLEITSNNDGRLDYDGILKKSSRFKFSKIKNFYHFEPKLSFNDE